MTAADWQLTSNNSKEQMSIGMLRCVVAQAGCTLNIVEVDAFGVDATIKFGGELYIDVQLKSTSSTLSLQPNGYAYSLNVKNYNELIKTQNIASPRLLVVATLPQNRADWVSFKQNHIELSKMLYWVSLQGLPEVDVTSNKTIYIPTTNKLDQRALITMLDNWRERESLI